MKIIVTGGTGMVGSEVIRSCIRHQFITHVYALVRKPLDPKLSSDPKVTEIMHEDFEQWPEHLMRLFEHEGVRGCIWCIGGWVNKFPNIETAQRVNIAMPQAAAEAFASHLSPSSAEVSTTKNKRGIAFRFVYMSVAGAEQNPFASLWYAADSRKAKGAAEKGLFEFANSREPGTFEVYSLRLGRVLPGGKSVYNLVSMGSSQSIADTLVARCAINTVLDGRTKDEGGRILENNDCLGDDWAQINNLSVE